MLIMHLKIVCTNWWICQLKNVHCFLYICLYCSLIRFKYFNKEVNHDMKRFLQRYFMCK